MEHGLTFRFPGCPLKFDDCDVDRFRELSEANCGCRRGLGLGMISRRMGLIVCQILGVADEVLRFLH